MDKDPQRELVYAMERRELRGHSLHRARLKHLRATMNRYCRKAGVKPPTLKVRRNSRYGELDVDFDPPRLTLEPTCGVNYKTLAHELAHHIVWMKYGNRAQDHGPVWVKTWIRLLHCFRIVPEAGMRAICRQYGIKIAR